MASGYIDISNFYLSRNKEVIKISDSTEKPQTNSKPKFKIATPHDLSERATWLRKFYFKGIQRKWKNDYASFSTNAPWGDYLWCEGDYYIVPEAMGFMGVKGKGLFGLSLAEPVLNEKTVVMIWFLR